MWKLIGVMVELLFHLAGLIIFGIAAFADDRLVSLVGLMGMFAVNISMDTSTVKDKLK